MVRHLVIAVALVGVTVGAGVHYDAAKGSHWPYPTEDQLYDDFERHVGEDALLWGEVDSIDPAAETATIEVETDDGSFAMTVRGFEANVEPGGVVQVYGTLEHGHAITAETVDVVERSPGARLYKYSISAVGGLLALAAFFRYWRIDLATMTFEPR